MWRLSEIRMVCNVNCTSRAVNFRIWYTHGATSAIDLSGLHFAQPALRLLNGHMNRLQLLTLLDRQFHTVVCGTRH